MTARLRVVAVALFVLVPGWLAAATPQLNCVGGTSPSAYLATAGVVRAWGANTYGQLGNGTNTDSNVPVAVAGLTDVAQVSAGTFHSLALKCDGTVWAWGRNDSGQLGDGGTSNSNVPVQVSGLANVVKISAGDTFSLALRSDGTVWAWGSNNSGRLGDGNGGADLSYSDVPVQVAGLTGIWDISAGDGHAVATDTAKVWGWGFNYYGEVGNGTSGSQNSSDTFFNTPQQVLGIPAKNVIAVSAAPAGSMALFGDGTVMAWGYNGGAWGNGSNAGSTSAVVVGSGDAEVAIGDSHSLFVKNPGGNSCSGDLYASGDNSHGALGDGTNTFSNVPVQTQLPKTIDWCTAQTSGQANVAAAFHSLASLYDGTAWAWGSNDHGQLGNGNNADSNVPVQVVGLQAVVSVSAGGDHSGNPGHSLAIVAPTLATGGSVSLGTVGTGTTSQPQTVTITNDGPGPITIGSILECTNCDAGFTFSLPSLPATIQEGDSLTFSVTYSPGTFTGNAQTFLALYHSGWDEGGFRNYSTVSFYATATALADLSLAASPAPSTALPGDTISYTVNVTNNGPAAADTVTISDVLPAGLTFVSCSSTGGGACGGSGGSRTIAFTSFRPGNTAVVTIQATVDANVADNTTLTNGMTGSIVTAGSCMTCDPIPANNTVSWNTIVHNRSDLFVTNQASLTSVKSGAPLTYTVTVANLGPYGAAGVVVSDTVPANSSFVSLTAPVACSAPAPGAVGTITCPLGALPSGASAVISVTVNVSGSSNKDAITDTASATSITFDPNAANNAATVTTKIYGNRK